MALRNVMIITEGSEEQMQGVIRGIESLDKDHKVGIIYGTNGTTAVSEVELILADLSNALVIKTSGIQLNIPDGKELKSIEINVPDRDRDTVIKYIQDEYPNLIDDILKN